jgi:dipeptidyl-peptidase-4
LRAKFELPTKFAGRLACQIAGQPCRYEQPNRSISKYQFSALILPRTLSMPRKQLAHLLLILVFVLSCWPCSAQNNELTVDRIFGANEFAAENFSVNWMPEGGSYFVNQPAKSGQGDDIVLIDPLNPSDTKILIAAKDLIPAGKTEPIKIDSFQVSNDGNKILIFNNTERVWRYKTRGDYWMVDLQKNVVRQLGRKNFQPSQMKFAKFSPDGKWVAYVYDRNIYVENLNTKAITPITQAESENIINGTSDWVYEEELSLRDGFQWSQDGNQIVFWRFDTRGVGVFTMINNTDQLYPRLIKFQYPKVGTTNSAVSIGIYDFVGGETKYVKLPGDPRENYPAKIDWVPGSNEFLLQYLNRLQNTNSVLAVDATSGQFRTVFEDKDPAWVEVCRQIQWSPDGKQFTFISESDGWKHAYLIDVQTGQRTLLTPGDFDIVELYRIDQVEKACYFLASPQDATSRYLYRQAFQSDQLQRLTPANQTGWHEYSFAADGKTAVHQWSKMGQPPIVETIRVATHQPIEVKRDNSKLTERLDSLAAVEHDFLKLEIDADGQPLSIDAFIMYPPKFDRDKKYPVLVYVYGEPAGTTVTNKWGGSRELWHRMMCEKGYVVMSFDNRGAKCPRGTGFRKAIYKKIGIMNASDQAKSLQAALAKFSFLDADRVGIWGWSGGGSSTLNALFQYPDLYKIGISVAPVPNQLYYDTIYQERYMQTPDLNPEGFKLGSPITHARNLTGKLLLVHGTGDDNCHYQTMELLINELIAEDKQFEMMAYPNRSHGIYEYENTRPHLHQLMARFFLEHLPPNDSKK